MFRTLALTLLALAAACSAAPAAPAAPLQGCVTTIAFESEASRREFLFANEREIVRAVSDQDAFLLTSEDGATVRVFSQSACNAPLESLRLTVDANAAMSTSMQDAQDINDFLSSAISTGRTHLHQAGCIARSVQREMFVGDLVNVAPFVGLRRLQLQAEDSTLYWATDDDCTALATFAPAVLGAVGRSTDIDICEHRTLRECGLRVGIAYPQN